MGNFLGANGFCVLCMRLKKNCMGSTLLVNLFTVVYIFVLKLYAVKVVGREVKCCLEI